MKLFILFTILISTHPAFAERGPYFPSSDKAPISHGKVIFNSPELSQISGTTYIGNVVIEKFKGNFEVGPMLYSCIFNDEDGAYGSLGCKYLRYDQKNARNYKNCEIIDSNEFYCN